MLEDRSGSHCTSVRDEVMGAMGGSPPTEEIRESDFNGGGMLTL